MVDRLQQMERVKCLDPTILITDRCGFSTGLTVTIAAHGAHGSFSKMTFTILNVVRIAEKKSGPNC